MSEQPTTSSHHLPLEPFHIEAGARFGDFAGWRMPLSYEAGVMQEHLHTREKAGLFDISHMRLFEVSGSGAAAMLSRACPLAAEALAPGSSKYTLLLNEHAGIVDDLIVTRLAEARFLVVANAARAAEDEAQLRSVAAGYDCTLEPLERIFLALQGPRAAAILSAHGFAVDSLTFMTGFEPQPGWFVSRSGYTGEDGFEIAVPADDDEADRFVRELLAVTDVMWIGLAARDSLRLEAGLCLYGQDLDEDTDPTSAGLLWAIPKPVRETGDFIGAPALRAIIADGARLKRVGLKPDGRQPVRAGALLFDADGAEVGRVTSGGFGPSVGHPVAMAYVRSDLARAGTELFAEVRGKRIPARVHSLPFTPHRYVKG